MTRLVWDKLNERGFETGVDHGVLYLQENGQYPKGEVWNGLTGITESPSGAEPTAMWADNIKYVNLLSAEEFAATIEAFFYPDGFKKCNGEVTVAKGMRIGQQTRQPFGLCYRTWNGNAEKGQRANYTIHIIYNATASPSERAYATESDSPDLTSMSWELSTTPMDIEGHNPTAYIAIESETADTAKLKELEDILYGSADSEARLPLPDEIITLLGEAD